MKYKIYSKDGGTVKAETSSLEYSGAYMGERYLTVTVKSPYPIVFEHGDYIIFRDEKFSIDLLSSEKRQGKSYYSGEAVLYENLRLYSTERELENCQMCDYVPDDNNQPYSARGEFSFYVESVEDFGQRVQANLDEAYGKGVWTVAYGENLSIDASDTMAVNADTSVYAALGQFYETFGVNFVVKGRTITFGATMGVTGHKYIYGKGNGLLSLGRTTDDSQRIVTKLKAYGSSRNIPYDYYNKLGGAITGSVKSAMRGERNGNKCYGMYIDIPKIYLSDTITVKLPDDKGSFTGTWGQTEDTDTQTLDTYAEFVFVENGLIQDLGDETHQLASRGFYKYIPAGSYKVNLSAVEFKATVSEWRIGETFTCDVQLWEIQKYWNFRQGQSATYEAQLGIIKYETGSDTELSFSDNTVEINNGIEYPLVIAVMSYKGKAREVNMSVKTGDEPLRLYTGEEYPYFFIHTCDGTDDSDYAAMYEYLSESLSDSGSGLTVTVTSGANRSTVPPEYIHINGERYNFYAPNLMLPGFPLQSLADWAESVAGGGTEIGQTVSELVFSGWKFSNDATRPWIKSPSYDSYGLKDGEVTFDGNDTEWDEVYPSIESMTTTELGGIDGYAGSVTYADSGAVDCLISGTDVKDNGVSSNGVYDMGSTDTNGVLISTSVTVCIPNIGFDLWSYKSTDGDAPTISFKSGMCGGRSFEILRCVPADSNDITKGYNLTLQRVLDQSINMYYPNSSYNLAAGDKYVLTNIEMPDVYMDAASVRLFIQSVDWLKENSEPSPKYQPEIDDIFMARNPDHADELTEGVYFTFADEDMGIAEIGVTIQNLVIKDDGKDVCHYEITLGDDTEVSLIDTIDVKINKATQGNSGLAQKLINDLLSAFEASMKSMFLRKDISDTAQGVIKFMRGAEFGEFIDSMIAGNGTGILPEGRIQTDRLEVRGSMTVMDLIINQIQGMEADYSFTEAGKISQVDDLGDNTYKLWIEKRTKYDFLKFQENDVCYSIINTLYKGGTDYFTSWMRILTTNMTENTATVVLYADSEVPGGKNYAPIAGYNLTRRGNSVIPDTESDETNERAQSWLLSSSEGRIMFLSNVFKPILEDYNYKLVVGKLPNLPSIEKLPVSAGEYGIMADVVIAQNFYEFDGNGELITKKVDRGEWSYAVAISDAPYRNTTYSYTTPAGANITRLEQHTVYHLGCKWGCLTDKTTTEPKWNSADWEMLEGDPNYYLQIESSNGYAFRRSSVDTDLEAKIFYGNIDITTDIMATVGTDVTWTRDTGQTADDNTWQPSYVDDAKNVIHIDNSSEHGIGSGFGIDYKTATFTCSVFIPVGGSSEKTKIEGNIKFT